jgi:uncharacterized protein YjbI with pentapeptide repeats
MAEDKGTSTPEQPKEPARGGHIPRVVVVALLASLSASCIVLFFFAGDVAAFLIAGRDIDKQAALWGIRTVAVLVVMGALGFLIRIGYDYQWTGLGEANLPKEKDVELRPKKTLWEWLQLLIVPIVLSLITVAFTWQQDARQQEAEERRAEVDRQIEEHRADDDALQAYLNQMSTLMLEKDLRSSTEDNATEDSKEARTLARARTLTALARLDSERKAEVMQFLSEAGLVEGSGNPVLGLTDADHPIVELTDADLSGVTLRHTSLDWAVLNMADLSEADLFGARLHGADLRGADLSEADLRVADLTKLEGFNVDLSKTTLRLANLSSARLTSADLSEANLTDATLSDANLSGADLSGAFKYNNEGTRQLITGEELELQASSLEGATMPNGQKYEDWLKSKGSGDDGENP